jgi:glyoxylase-like metal-dependent hydrolase (beta-lactamase superfamily II)
MINLFSKFNTPPDIRCFPGPAGATRGIFPVIGTVEIGDMSLEVLESLGGHTFGQVFLYSWERGLLFAADSVINFASLSKERADYSSLAAFLVTSVNVDSELATKERRALLELARATDEDLKKAGKRCLVCGGHGAVSVVENGKLAVAGQIERYNAKK